MFAYNSFAKEIADRISKTHTHIISTNPAREEKGDSLVFSPVLGFKPTISGTGYSTLIPRGKHRDRKLQDSPITRASQEDKPKTGFRQKEDLENKFL